MVWVVYWHRCANSGLWFYYDEKKARETAEWLSKIDDVYKVSIIKAESVENIKL